MGLLKLFIGSFHSAAPYRYMRASKSIGLGYALFVVLITTLFVTLYYGSYFHREVFAPRQSGLPVFDDVIRQIAGQVPTMTLHDNTLQTAQPGPTTIYISADLFGERFERVALITIDTSGQASHETMQTPLLVTNKDLLIKNDNKTEIKSLSELTKDGPSTLLITPSVAHDLANQFVAFIHAHLSSIYLWFGIFAWLGIAFVMCIARFFLLMALGVAGMIMASTLRIKVEYPTLVGLAAASFTPIACLDTLLFTFFNYPTSRLVIFTAGCVALFAALKASDSPDPNARIG